MTPSDILADCWTAGVVLKVEGDKLLYDAPVGAMTPGLLFLLRTYRSEVMELLTWLCEAAQHPVSDHTPVYCLRNYESPRSVPAERTSPPHSPLKPDAASKAQGRL
ncbi:MAG: hypothetical protein HUU15_02430 [Candidatus Brocadiae bacterium]|nr:hypothetical protein [Candidatus Brocadiia bacterium]